MDALSLENVTKTYDSITAVNAVNLRVRQGAVLGLLGPNGAGKTTTIRMVMNILVPDEGSIRVLDKPVSDGGLALSRPIASAVIGAFIIVCILVLPQRAGQHPGQSEMVS